MAFKILMRCRRLSNFRQQSHRSSINNAAAAAAGEAKSKVPNNVEMVAMCIPLAFTALTLGAYMVTNQLSNSPSVRVNKKLRGTMPEVEQPDQVADEGSRYVNRTFFRKVAN